MSGEHDRPPRGEGDSTLDEPLERLRQHLVAQTTDEQDRDSARLREIADWASARARDGNAESSWLLDYLRSRGAAAAGGTAPENLVTDAIRDLARNWRHGFLMITTGRRILFANDAAEAMAAGGAWKRDGDDALALADGASTVRLNEALAAMSSSGDRAQPVQADPVYLPAAGSGGPAHYVLCLAPLGRFQSGALAGGLAGGAAAPLAPSTPVAPFLVALTMADLREPPRIASGILENVFRLTPAEARLAEAFAAGEGLKDYAAQHGVALPTVRTQFAQIKRKLGARDQAEVVRLILTAAALG